MIFKRIVRERKCQIHGHKFYGVHMEHNRRNPVVAIIPKHGNFKSTIGINI